MSEHLFGRHCHTTHPIAIRGEGCYLFDQQGKRYLDGSGGAAVSCLGHGHPEILDAMHDQLNRLEFAHTGFLDSLPACQLADQLIASAPKGINRVYLVSGGSEAVEAALKLARQYFVETGAPTRHRVIARRQSYHGNTLGALAVGGNVWRRKPYQPLLAQTSHIMPCFAYREQKPDETNTAFAKRAAQELEEEILRLGSDNVMAFIAETVVGATLGAVPPVAEYFKAIRRICTQYGVLLIADEVMCGMGRCGQLYSILDEEISPDIITIAKGLGGGYQPIGAMLCTEEIFQALKDGSGLFQHGHTYMGHPIAAAAASKVVEILSRPETMPFVRQQGALLEQQLHHALDDNPSVGDIRGRGLFWGIELVQNRARKQPFDPEQKIHAKIKAHAFSKGLICYPMGGTVDGAQGDHILLAPPFTISDQEIAELVDILTNSIHLACQS